MKKMWVDCFFLICVMILATTSSVFAFLEGQVGRALLGLSMAIFAATQIKVIGAHRMKIDKRVFIGVAVAAMSTAAYDIFHGQAERAMLYGAVAIFALYFLTRLPR